MLGKAIFSMVAFLKFVHLSGFLGGDYSNNGILFATMNPEFEKTKFDSRSGEKKIEAGSRLASPGAISAALVHRFRWSVQSSRRDGVWITPFRGLKPTATFRRRSATRMVKLPRNVLGSLAC